jgi:hypothetical protein
MIFARQVAELPDRRRAPPLSHACSRSGETCAAFAASSSATFARLRAHLSNSGLTKALIAMGNTLDSRVRRRPPCRARGFGHIRSSHCAPECRVIDAKQRRHACRGLHAALNCIASMRNLLGRELAGPPDMFAAFLGRRNPGGNAFRAAGMAQIEPC